MSQQVTEPGPPDLRVLPAPRPRLLPRAPHARAPWADGRPEGTGGERLDRREALLHLLELDRQRRRYRSA